MLFRSAILTLDDDVGRVMGTVEVAPFDRERLTSYRQLGANFVHAGYSQDKAHVLTMHAGCKVTGFRLGESIAYHDCDATHGDSGSPILVKIGDRYRIVGLHVATVVGENKSDARGIAITGSSILGGMDGLRSRAELERLRPIGYGTSR